MGWDNGKYYTRSKKVNGRVVREYVGTGVVGQLAARLDAAARQARELKRAELLAQRERIVEMEAPVEEFAELADAVLRAALAAAGYHQHKRGEWRRKRVRSQETAGAAGE